MSEPAFKFDAADFPDWKPNPNWVPQEVFDGSSISE